MKKRIIMLLLCLSMVTTIVACAEKKPAQNSKPTDSEVTDTDNVDDTDDELTEAVETHRSNIKETDSETGETYYLLADFEDYFECSQIKYACGFGKLTQIKKSENSDMVTYGEQSLKMEVLGNEQAWGQKRPYMFVSTDRGFFNETQDFSNMTKFTFDIYNDQEEERIIRFWWSEGVSESYTSYEQVLLNDDYTWQPHTRSIKLKPKQWNHIEITPEQMMGIKPTATLGLSSVGAFNIMFERYEVYEEIQVFYIDNMRIYIKE